MAKVGGGAKPPSKELLRKAVSTVFGELDWKVWVYSWEPFRLAIHGGSNPDFERLRAGADMTAKDQAPAVVIDALVHMVQRQQMLTFPTWIIRRPAADAEARAVNALCARYRKRIVAAINDAGYQGVKALSEGRVIPPRELPDEESRMAAPPGPLGYFAEDLPPHLVDDLHRLAALEATPVELRKAVKYVFRSPLSVALEGAEGDPPFRLVSCSRAEALLRGSTTVCAGPDAARVAVLLSARFIAETTTEQTLRAWHLDDMDIPGARGPLVLQEIEKLIEKGRRGSGMDSLRDALLVHFMLSGY